MKKGIRFIKNIANLCFACMIMFLCSAQTEVCCEDVSSQPASNIETKNIRVFFAGTSIRPANWSYLQNMLQLFPEHKNMIYKEDGNTWSYYFPGSLNKLSLDMGRYSIPNNIKRGVEIIKNNISVLSKLNSNIKINVDIYGHSRGAVAAGGVAEKIKKEYGNNDNIKVNLTSLDPVPGPDRILSYGKLNLGNLDKSACVYSLYTPLLHWPQKLSDCKVIIINNTDHDGVYGYKSSNVGDTIDVYYYKFKGQKYFLSQLSSLEPNIYFCKSYSELEALDKSNCKTCLDLIREKSTEKRRKNMLVDFITNKLNLTSEEIKELMK